MLDISSQPAGRRKLAVGLTAFAGLAALTGCGTSTTGSSTFSLAQIQAQVAAINTGIQSANTIFQASTTATAAQKALAASTAQAAASAAAAVAGLSAASTSTAPAILNTFIASAQTLVPLLAPVFGVNPAAAAAITLGIALVQAFAGSVSLPVVVTAPAGLLRYGAVAEAPVPIPVLLHRPK